MFYGAGLIAPSAVQTAAAVIANSGTMLSYFNCLAIGAHFQRFRMSGRYAGCFIGKIDKDINDIIVVFVVGDQDHFYHAGIVAAVIDTNADCRVALCIFLFEEHPDRIAVKGFRMAKIHGILEGGPVSVTTVHRSPETGRILDSGADGENMGFDAVLVDGRFCAAAGITAGETKNR